jgi:methionyl aminopeptidase
MAKRKRIPLKSPAEVRRMRVSCETAAAILLELRRAVVAGCTTGEIDALAGELMAHHGCRSAFRGYRGFPGRICISVNDQVVHGIGGPRRIQPGDIVKIDVGIVKDGWIGDNATTVAVGQIDLETRRLLVATEQALFEAIARARPGEPLSDVCGAVEDYVRPRGFTVVRDFVGHGVGRNLHEEPQVPNYRTPGKGPDLKPGMTLAIEPMVNAGRADVRVLTDGWTVITADHKPSAHYEHVVLVTEGEPEILTWRPREALPEHFGL